MISTPSSPLKNSDGPTSASFRPDRTVDSRRIRGDMPSNRRRNQDESSLDLGRAGVLQRAAKRTGIPSQARRAASLTRHGGFFARTRPRQGAHRTRNPDTSNPHSAAVASSHVPRRSRRQDAAGGHSQITSTQPREPGRFATFHAGKYGERPGFLETPLGARFARPQPPVASAHVSRRSRRQDAAGRPRCLCGRGAVAYDQ